MTARKHVFACIDAHPKSMVLLRAAASKAKDIGASWSVIYVETPEHDAADRESRTRILRYLTASEEMGASIERIEGRDIVQGIVSAVHQCSGSGTKVDALIMGQTPKEGMFAELKASLAEKVARKLRGSNISVQIIPLSGTYYKPSWFDRLQFSNVRRKDLVFAVLSALVALAFSEIARAFTPDTLWNINAHNVMAVFLLATIISALRHGLLPGLLSGIIGFALINYFYVKPFYSFNISHVGGTVSLIIFLCSALIISLIGAFSLSNTASAVRKERRSQALHRLHRTATAANDRAEALAIMHEELSQLLEMDVAFYLPSPMNPDALAHCHPSDNELDDNEAAALAACWQNIRTTGLGTANRFNISWRFEPMTTPNGEIGVLAIKAPVTVRLDASFGRLISALADQAATVLERLELSKMMSESRVREEREKLRAMLLSSVSHDLKTPLASIIGSLSVYKRMKKSGRLTEETEAELTETALDEAQRLDGFITNILDMTRIESGDIHFNSDWVNAQLPIKAVQKRLTQRLRHHQLQIFPPEQSFEAQMDKMMCEQVLQNVIDNAAKYSPAKSEIHLHYAMDENDGAYYSVRDHGAGIPDDKLDAVFDKYERLKQSDSQVAGTGLGLAISKAIIEKQGGSITVRNHPDGGAEFTIHLPKARIIDEKGE